MQNNKQATIIRRAFLKIMGKQNNTDLHQRKKVEMQELKKSYQHSWKNHAIIKGVFRTQSNIFLWIYLTALSRKLFLQKAPFRMFGWVLIMPLNTRDYEIMKSWNYANWDLWAMEAKNGLTDPVTCMWRFLSIVLSSQVNVSLCKFLSSKCIKVWTFWEC